MNWVKVIEHLQKKETEYKNRALSVTRSSAKRFEYQMQAETIGAIKEALQAGLTPKTKGLKEGELTLTLAKERVGKSRAEMIIEEKYQK